MQHFHLTIFRISLLAILTCAGISISAQTADTSSWYVSGPWETSNFSEDIPAIRKAADANHYATSQPVTLFMTECYDRFQIDGSLERQSTVVYRIENADGLKNWSDTEINYSPWHQDSPKLHVRIINPDNRIIELTEKDMIEVSTGNGDDLLYTDQKTLKAPFPNVMVGSIIEEQITTISRPYLESSGIEDQWTFTHKFAVGFNRLVVSYPTGLKLQYKAASMSLLPVKTKQDSLNILTWEFRNQAPRTDYEDFTPPENRQRPGVTVGSAPSWQVIAERYAKQVEKSLKQQALIIPAGLKLPRKDAKAATLAASAWINSAIRYTGLELGNNSIIPFSPQQVISRGYGDCKDKATLLVALLRSAGYKAWVSLIRTGPGWDIDPDISGMTSFNHAIVYIEDAGGFWFDPTVEINRSTDLPNHDQYRYTLIARPGQKTISRTPSAKAAENVVTEYRDFTMSETGKGSVTETTEYTGAWDSWYRNMMPYRDPKKTREALDNYMDSYYGTKKVSKAEWANPHDLDKAYSVSVSGSEINRAITNDTEAEFSLTLNNLRSLFDATLVDEKDPKRTQAFRFNLPFTYELISTVKLPAGFQVRTMPSPITMTSSGFLFRRTWEMQKDGTLRGLSHFETLQQQFDPTEFVTLRSDLKKLFDDYGSVTIFLDHQGVALGSEGRYAEAFDVYRQLLQDNPNSAIQNKRLSVALHSYSLGQPAVFYARRATELDPTDAEMWANLANMLMTDGLGRRLNKGYDRQGAIKAWQKAMELAPDNKIYQANLAILYEYNSDGDRYQNSEDLKLARDAYLGLSKSLDEYNLQFNLWNVQIRLNELVAAKAILPQIKDEAQRNIGMVVTEILSGNPAPPMKLLEQNLNLEKRQGYLAGAAENLIGLRHYGDAARVLRQAAIANKDAANLENRADMLQRIKAWDSAGVDTSTPEGALKNFFYDYLITDAGTAAIFPKYFSKTFLEDRSDLNESYLIKKLQAIVDPIMGSGSPHLLADITLSLLSYESSGDDRQGYRLIAAFDGAAAGSFQFFLTKEASQYKIVSWSSLFSVIGHQINNYLDQNQEAIASKWFNWIFIPAKGQSTSTLNMRFFTDERLPRNSWFMHLVADEMALADLPLGKAAPGIASQWLKLSNRELFLADAAAHEIPNDLQKDLWNSLSYVLADIATQNMVFDQARQIGAVLATYLQDDSQFTEWYAVSKAIWGDNKEAETIIEGLRDSKPDDREVFSTMLRVYGLTLNFAKMDTESAKYPARLTAGDLNNLSWNELFRNPNGKLAASAMEQARKAVNLSQAKNRAILHTLATIYATSGRYDEARSVLAKVIELNPGKEPTADDWYVIGLIADGYGFHDAALEAWHKVTRDENSIPGKTDTWVLAQAKLQANS